MCCLSHQNPMIICLELFLSIFTCKRCLICADVSLDSGKTTFKRYYGLWNYILAGSNSLMIIFLGWICFLQTHSFCLLQMLSDGLEWCGSLACDVFISCLDSHSDGTHSLQSIHWWASDGMLHYPKSDDLAMSCQIYGKCWLHHSIVW